MNVPRGTMRLQFHHGFKFADATALIGYFAALGISHLYASPIMTARAGSMHGYDTIDPTRVNPDLGGEAEFRRLVHELRRHGMGIIVDIVPNHMAVGSGNAWWMDVLARGQNSRYAKYFDIDWEPNDQEMRGKVLLPILGRPYSDALTAGEITLQADDPQNLFVRYFDHIFPLAAESAEAVTAASHAAFDPASAAGRQRLHALLEAQHFRLAWWRSANDKINWRRFFDINELAAIRVEDDEVFEAVHETLFRLYAQGLIDGVRIDHIDGLAQPADYCRKLRARLHALETQRPTTDQTGPAYFVVEKILASDEQLPPEWQADGTTGYDFMDEVNALAHDDAGQLPLTELWHRISGRPGSFDPEEELARRQILDRSFSAQRESVVDSLYEIAQSDLTTREISRPAIRRGLTEILVHFPVYRIYAGVEHTSLADIRFMSQAITQAKLTGFPGDVWLIETLGRWLSGQRIRPEVDALQNAALIRFEQLSAPLCAKAVEDTAFYRYGRLISRNDVGFNVRQLSCRSDEFHDKMKQRAAYLPHAMLATATHDHKRGEDVRARLAVISEMPSEWATAVERWIELSAPHCVTNGGPPMPSAADLLMLFQTIVGAWPMTLSPGDKRGLAGFSKRIAAWQQKALREAKLHSDWSAPNHVYERAADDFITWLFFGPSEVLREIAHFARRIAPAGAVNGLAQVSVKLTAPGVPDIYQGTEYWDLSLVDPDNRAAVDFAARQSSLGSVFGDEGWTDGSIKQFVTARILAVRKKNPEIFSEGDYLPLDVSGPKSSHVVAYARILPMACAIVVVCRSIAHLMPDDSTLNILASHWNGTCLVVPPELQGTFSNAFFPEETIILRTDNRIAQILSRFPVAILTNHSA
jgi:(1->4)-alpha-D-glucan 1-alpha-D-glucosylmutase